MSQQQWCSWHKAMADEPVLVGIIEANSGPGGSVYACRPCVDTHRLKPVAAPPTGGPPSPRPGS